jgi:NAD+ kinase
MDGTPLNRLGLVVHPRRQLEMALATLQRWSDDRGIDLVQVPAAGQDRVVAQQGDPEECDAIVALGGDGTTLAALRTGALAQRPVLGVACGSLGALTAVTAPDLADALDRLAAGDWQARKLPALAVAADGAEPWTGVNDVVLVRQGAGQVSAEVSVDGELFVRFAGDGLVVATQLGSSAYTLAAGGPVVAPHGSGLVVTPVAPHGGCCPPLVTGHDSTVSVLLHPGHGGARVELDGQVHDRVDPHAPRTFEMSLRDEYATLVMLGGEESLLEGLRRRRIIIDSPRMLARDDREAAPVEPETGQRV